MNKPTKKEKIQGYIGMGIFGAVVLGIAGIMIWVMFFAGPGPKPPACFPTAVAAAPAASAANAQDSSTAGDGSLPTPCSTDAGELQKLLQTAANTGQANPHLKHITFIGNDQVKIALDGNRAATIMVPAASVGDLFKLTTAAGISNSAESPSMFANLFGMPGLLIGFLLLSMLPMLRMQMMGQKGQAGALGFAKSRHRKVEFPSVTLDDVQGIDEAREELEEVVNFLKDPVAAGRLGGRVPKGVLLVGGPGVGKTLTARAIAGEASKDGRPVAFFTISGSEFVEMFVGVGASRVRDLFEQGKANAPCIIFIDEIDAVGRQRGAGMGGGNDEREQTLNQMLVEMDGFDSSEGVIIIAATNRPDVLDPALLRPGRFDRQVVVPSPEVNGREKILAVHMKKIKVAADVKPRIIARGTPGFSGADLANLVNEAALLATKLGLPDVTMKCFELSKDKVMAGAARPGTLAAMSEAERRLTSYHEGAHTLGMVMTPGAMPLHKVTIMPRGQALGLTMWLPPGDKYSKTKREMRAQLLVLYAGREGELLLVGEDDITTGASGDYQMATDDCQAYVGRFGFGALPPLVYVSDNNSQPFLGKSMTQRRHMSDKTAQLVDDAMMELATERQLAARTCLQEGKAELIAMSELLHFAETLTADQVHAVLKGVSAVICEAGDQPVLTAAMTVEAFGALGVAVRPLAEKFANLMDGESKDELILDACVRYGEDAAKAILKALPIPAAA